MGGFDGGAGVSGRFLRESIKQKSWMLGVAEI